MEIITNYLSVKFHPILQSMTKLRFKDDSLVMKEYIEYCRSYLASKIIAIRLNMSKVKENYRRKIVARQCRLCHETRKHRTYVDVLNNITRNNQCIWSKTDRWFQPLEEYSAQSWNIWEEDRRDRKKGITRNRGSTAGLNDF